ncbi:MAG: hypothetical protein ABSF16_13770 [Terracidiphilus sp.]|jgi:hypothetical protein
MDRIVKGFIVTLFGIATTVLTAAGLVYMELHYDCAIYGFVYAFVLPFGAFISGVVAASGYYFGSRLLSFRPGRGVLLNMVAVSGANFFFIYWLKYQYLTVDGEAIRKWISYPAYLTFTLSHTSVTFDQFTRDTVALGFWGYAYAALQIAGFAFGGYCIYKLVRSAPYCDGCGFYLKLKGKQTRYFERLEKLADCLADFRLTTGRGEFRKAMDEHADAGSKMVDDAKGYSAVVEVHECKGCGKQWFDLHAKQRVNKKWHEIAKLRYSTFSSEKVDALEEMTGAA